MNKLIVKIEPGMGKQQVLFYKDDEFQTSESVSLTGLTDFLLNTCYTEGYDNVHFMGNWKFLEGIVNEFARKELTNYSSNKIFIEVN